ncbi:MAG: universal stress protein [Candidatus Rokuibacteriota bacterium]
MRVLLPVDGSANSLIAATALKHLGGLEEVVVLHALDLPSLAYPIGRPEVDLAIPLQVEKALREDGERILEKAIAGLPKEIPSVENRLETGSAPDVIVDLADRDHIELIVMGARGLSPLQEALLGSVSHAVVSHAPCPVLLVREPVHGLRRILVPLQGPVDARAAAHFLEKKPFGASVDVTLVHVLPYEMPMWPGGLPEAKAHSQAATQEAREFLGGVVQELVGAKIPATFKLLSGRAQLAIVEELRTGSYDVAVLGTRRRGVVKRLFLGSVSHAVVHHTRCPVLILP